MCATACFDIGYKVSDIQGGPKKWYLSYNVIYVQKVSLFWPTLYVMMKVIQLRRNASAFYLQWERMSGVVWRIVEPTYHSSVEWFIADVTDASTLHQLSVFNAWVIVRLTLRYTRLRYTRPDIRCRDRLDECGGGIIWVDWSQRERPPCTHATDGDIDHVIGHSILDTYR